MPLGAFQSRSFRLQSHRPAKLRKLQGGSRTMKNPCLTCEAIRQMLGDYSDPSMVCPTCRSAVPVVPEPWCGMKPPGTPNRHARKKRDDDDDDDKDDDDDD